MNKTDLVTAIANSSGLTKADAERALNAFTRTLLESLRTAGSRVCMTGFGTFQVQERAARKGRNPLNGEPVDIPPSKTIIFKPSPQVKKRLQ